MIARRFAALLVALVLPLALGACAGAPPAAQTATAPPATPTVPATAAASPAPTDAGSEGAASPTRTAAPPPTATPTPGPAVEPAGEVTVGGLGAPDSLNPYLDDSQANRWLTPLLFESLLAVAPDDGRLTPALARDVLVSDDGLTLTFHLSENGRWHDGRPVTARDVIFTWQSMLDTPRYHRYWFPPERISALAAPDEATVVVTLPEANCSLLYALGQAPILPQHLLAEEGVFAADFGRAPVGSGPFALARWAGEGDIELVRREDGASAGDRPGLAAWTYRPAADANELQQALAAGAIDAAVLPGAGAAPSGLTSYAFPLPEMYFVAFNLAQPPLDEVLIRQALAQALDRDRILAEALPGGGLLLGNSLGPGHWADRRAGSWPAYDPDRARSLLAEAGLRDVDRDGWLDRDGEPLRLALRTNADNDLRRALAILVSQYWRAVGVNTAVELVDWPILVDDLFTHDFEAVVFSWPLAPDPDQTRYWGSAENTIGSGLNVVSLADDAVDRWLAAGLATPGCDLDARAATYTGLQTRLAELRPYDFLLLPEARLVARPDLRGPAPGLWAGPFWNGGKWFLAE